MEKPKTEESQEKPPEKTPPKEVGGSAKPEATRYGDWEINGKCVDF
jgi:hypothetical protein